MLRLIPTADHTMEDVEMTIKAFTEIADKLNKGLYAGKLTNIPV
jgi:glycine C-acetyltransferase